MALAIFPFIFKVVISLCLSPSLSWTVARQDRAAGLVHCLGLAVGSCQNLGLGTRARVRLQISEGQGMRVGEGDF